MPSDATLDRLREENVVTAADAARLADAIELRSLVNGAVDAADGRLPEAVGRSSRVGKRRRSVAYGLAGIAAAAFVVAVSPAWALIRDVLPFERAPQAPASVRVDFASLNSGAPTAGMKPQALADQTRRVLDVPVNGADHVLYVAPTAKGGFCFDWTGWWGGCDADGSSQLAWQTSLEIPPGVTAPTIPPAPPSGPHYVKQEGAWEQAIKQTRALAVPTWIAGVVNVSGAQTVVVEFSDGSSVNVPIAWISAPISAGFFSYLPPADKRTETDHVTNVEALDGHGNVTAQQPLSR